MRHSNSQCSDAQGTATDASTAYVGNFREVLLGMRPQVRIEVSWDGIDSVLSKGLVFVRAYMRADVQLAHADQLVRIIGIIP